MSVYIIHYFLYIFLILIRMIFPVIVRNSFISFLKNFVLYHVLVLILKTLRSHIFPLSLHSKYHLTFHLACTLLDLG